MKPAVDQAFKPENYWIPHLPNDPSDLQDSFSFLTVLVFHA